MFQKLNIEYNIKKLRQHNHFITQGNYKTTCFDYRLVILRLFCQLCHKMLCTHLVTQLTKWA